MRHGRGCNRHRIPRHRARVAANRTSHRNECRGNRRRTGEPGASRPSDRRRPRPLASASRLPACSQPLLRELGHAVDAYPTHGVNTVLTIVERSARFACLAGEIDMAVVTDDGRRNETTTQYDCRNAERSRGMMQSAFWHNRKPSSRQRRERMPECRSLDHPHAGQAAQAMRELSHVDAGLEQPAGEHAEIVLAPILICRHRFVPRHIWLDQYETAGQAITDCVLSNVKEDLAWRHPEIIIPFPMTRPRPILKPMPFVVRDPSNVGRAFLAWSSDARIIAEDLFRPRPPNDLAPITKGGAFTWRQLTR